MSQLLNVTGQGDLRRGNRRQAERASASINASLASNTQAASNGRWIATANVEGDAEFESGGYGHLGIGRSLKAHVLWSVEQTRNFDTIFVDSFENLVVIAGLNKLLDATFKTGLASPAWYIGLVDGSETPAYVDGDTMASHPGWAELTVYSQTTRPALVAGSIANGLIDNSASRAKFNITGNGTLAGFFLTDNSAINGMNGTLFSVGAFIDFPGGRDMVNDDIFYVTATISLSQS
jgi:hypothetical protein